MGVVKDFFRNWHRHEGETGHKLRIAARNRLRALKGGCCGQYGDPGC